MLYKQIIIGLGNGRPVSAYYSQRVIQEDSALQESMFTVPSCVCQISQAINHPNQSLDIFFCDFQVTTV